MMGQAGIRPCRGAAATPLDATRDRPPFAADRTAGTGFREPGFSKERRLDPQITIGLLTGQAGFR